jgi:hypothetical protein
LRVEKALIERGYTKCEQIGDACPPPMHFVREYYLKLQGCSNLDANKSYCRVDFVVTPPHGVPEFLDIDEGQHFERPTACEASRMTDVHAALALGGVTFTSLTWIRYNPHALVDETGHVVNGPKPSARLNWLVDFMERTEHAFAQGLRILYCFYDRVHGQLGPKQHIVPARCLEFDYAESLRAYSFDAHDDPWGCAPRPIRDAVADDAFEGVKSVVRAREANDRARLRAMMARKSKSKPLHCAGATAQKTIKRPHSPSLTY